MEREEPQGRAADLDQSLLWDNMPQGPGRGANLRYSHGLVALQRATIHKQVYGLPGLLKCNGEGRQLEKKSPKKLFSGVIVKNKVEKH